MSELVFLLLLYVTAVGLVLGFAALGAITVMSIVAKFTSRYF